MNVTIAPVTTWNIMLFDKYGYHKKTIESLPTKENAEALGEELKGKAIFVSFIVSPRVVVPPISLIVTEE